MSTLPIRSYKNLPLEIESINKGHLYHYTNIEAIFSIFKQEKLWFSKSDYLNDPSEVIYFHEILNEVCENMEQTGDVASFKSLVSNLISKESKFPFQVYVLSLTENSDSLALWSSYSEFIGYNIGINISSLINSLIHQNIHYMHGKVIYNVNEQKRIIERELKTLFRFFENYKHTDGNLALFNILFKRLFMYSIFFKKSPFYQEEEYRIALLFPSNDQTPFSNSSFEVKFRTFNEVLIPYIEVPILVDLEKLPIESITIGPKNTLDIAKEGLMYFLKTKNYDNIVVKKSNIPLRY
jgi:hypothetical protein